MNIFALGVFVSYFAFIIALFSLVVRSWAVLSKGASPHLGFVLLTIGSFLHTWYYMFRFIKWSFDSFESTRPTLSISIVERLSDWLANTALFEQAWAAVCMELDNWWWSEQLCLFTAGPWTVFLFLESRRLRIPHSWAYMFLGQLVAISVASNLFYIAILMVASNPRSKSPVLHAPLWVWLPVFLSLATIWRSPVVAGTNGFLPNLLIMHFLLIIPLLPIPHTASANPVTSGSISSMWLYAIVGSASLVIRLRTLHEYWVFSCPADVTSCVTLVIPRLWEALHSHPAQSSIGWDVLWTTVSFVLYSALRPGKYWRDQSQEGVKSPVPVQRNRIKSFVIDGVGSMLTSVGVVASTRLMTREAELQD